MLWLFVRGVFMWTAALKRDGHFIAGFRKILECKNVHSSWQPCEVPSTKWLFAWTADCWRLWFSATSKRDTSGRSCDWQKAFISLVWDNGRKLPVKPAFLRRFNSSPSWVTLLFFFFFSLSLLQLKSQTVPQKRKSVQISSPALRRSDERGGHEKRSSKAIFIPLQFEVLKLKLHMDAIEEINDNTRHLRLRHVHADQAAIIWNWLFSQISKSTLGYRGKPQCGQRCTGALNYPASQHQNQKALSK